MVNVDYLSKKFNGKFYNPVSGHETKKELKEAIKMWKNAGYKTRYRLPEKYGCPDFKLYVRPIFDNGN